ncbi:hypothetical protein BD779DRAFT_1498187 [Infundibulicybe gibba]|nr:hypothetical protein BD779DRAFT_1498187 [Infundibulicybe gibba]
MDRLESLGNTLSQITMYDIKSMYNQAKNVVLNVSEMEAKVREATNDEPWGASSTLMQEIAQGQHFNEIMPCIYARFMEKEARQWREIYKALQLLEYLIKHGSERVVDDARSHISTIKMLRNFHYIDEKGKDEGINVRNRSRELVELLSDVEKIRSERRKAKINKNKYVGTGNDGFGGGGMSFSSGGSRYGGFGSDSLGGGGGDYGTYGAGGSSRGSSSFRDDTRRGGFEEYNAGDDEAIPAPTPAPAPAPAPPPLDDLLGGLGDDDTFGSNSTAAPANNGLGGLATNKALPAVSKPSVGFDDDDFDDFKTAPVQPAVPTQAPTSAAAKPNLMDMLSTMPTTRPATTSNPMAGFGQPQAQPAPGYGMGMRGSMGMGMGVANMGMNTGMANMHRASSSVSSPTQFSSPMFSQPQAQQNMFGGGSAAPLKPTSPIRSGFSSPTTMRPGSATAAPAKPASTGNFDDLWSLSLGGGTKPAGPAGNTGKSIKDLEREKAMAGLWGAQKPNVTPSAPQMGGGSAGAFGSFGTSSTSGGGGGGGGDDLLL